MRKLILNLHLYGALIGGLFLIILGLTGSIIAFQPGLDHLLNPQWFKIEPQGEMLPLDKIEEAVQTAYPEKKFGTFRFPQAAGECYVAQSRSTQFFVNSYTGEVIGSRETPTTLDEIRSLHTSLWLGATGRTIVAAATILSIFLIVSGIYLWWPIRNTGTARGLSFYLHYALGIYFALFLLALAVSGAVIAYDEIISSWVYAATKSSPPPRYNAPSTVIQGRSPITATQAVDIATARLAGARPISVSIPDPQGSYGINLRYPESHEDSRVLVDQYSGAIISVNDLRAQSTGTHIMYGNGALHTGVIFGLPSQVLMSLSSLVLAVQTITGYLLWWKKLRRKPLVSA